MKSCSYKILFTLFCITSINSLSASFFFAYQNLNFITKIINDAELIEAGKLAKAYKEQGRLDQKNLHGKTCLQQAVENENLWMVKAFLAAGARDEDNKAWEFAQKSPKIKKIFLEHGRQSN